MELQFHNYLLKMGHTKSTIKSYLYAGKIFLFANPNAENYGYKDVVNYLSEITNKCKVKSRKHFLLYAIKKYYDHLIDFGSKDSHPCKNLQVLNSRSKSVIHQDLFTNTELEMLLNRNERYNYLKRKNSIVVSLLIYQGLTSSEISNLNLKDIDLEKGTILIRASRTLNKRRFSLNKMQLQIISLYLNEDRGRLIKSDLKAFVLGKLGKRISVDDIHYLISTFKAIFPERNLTPATIRKSVIANWLNVKKIPLEQVQLMSGQKWISSTLRYRQNNLEEQREMINRWFPL